MKDFDTMNYIIAIAFATGMLVFIVGMYGFQLIASGKRLRKARQLSNHVVEFTPAFVMIVFDDRDRVSAFKARSEGFEGYAGKAPVGRKRHELTFLPPALQNKAFDESLPHRSGKKVVAPLKMHNGNIRYIEWEMKAFHDNRGKTELTIATGFDITDLLQNQEKLKALSAKLEVAEERERKRIAEDLHDCIGEILITSSRNIDILKKKCPSQEVAQGLDEISRTIRRFMEGTRSLIFNLIPNALYDIGLGAAVDDMASYLSREHHITIKVNDGLPDCKIDQEIAIFLHKSTREFIMNAIKHGGADMILVNLKYKSKQIEVDVQDNGTGFGFENSVPELKTDSGFGLFNIKNRAAFYHGGVRLATSAALGGAQVAVWVSLLPSNGRILP